MILIEKFSEHGYNEALYGIGLNKSLTNPYKNWSCVPEEVQNRLYEVAAKLAKCDGGHNNFLEQIQTWWKFTLPLTIWKQMDRYRLKSQQSQSTMHTLTRSLLTQNDFNSPIPLDWLDELNKLIGEAAHMDREFAKQRFNVLVDWLPQGFLQTRVLNMNYKCVRNILKQRSDHKLGEWQEICKALREGVNHPEFLI